MPLMRWWEQASSVPGAPRVRRLEVEQARWRQVAQDVAASGGVLLALWVNGPATGGVVNAAYLADAGVLIAQLAIARAPQPSGYPGLEEIFPAASRLQRAAYDLSGVRSSDADARAWLDHTLPYEFVRVEGEGVHEFAVGPVHAGTIEPGHFRFSVVGEKVLRLEARLGYAHKGLEQRFSEIPILEGHRLAARVSGDSAVAFSWAYCQALEGMSGCRVPARALQLRAVCLELERLANHLGDLGALGNDAGFAFGLTHFSRLKENLLRAVAGAFGQRYLFDTVIPGGVAVDPDRDARGALTEVVRQISAEVAQLRQIYAEHEGVRDRFTGTGVLLPELAARLGVIGLVGRASGQARDVRTDLPCPPYTDLPVRKVVEYGGDVAARVTVRFEEAQQSAGLLVQVLSTLPRGEHRVSVQDPAQGAFGAGLLEGWRGPVFVALQAGPGGSIQRCHPHDPSWQNWPALEYAILGNIVPDFPLINKSFNLSYSGVDL